MPRLTVWLYHLFNPRSWVDQFGETDEYLVARIHHYDWRGYREVYYTLRKEDGHRDLNHRFGWKRSDGQEAEIEDVRAILAVRNYRGVQLALEAAGLKPLC
ncbi:MAG: hypothetical protein B7733_16990 [Myxococcales bacterium FL481]|nr:MAG: hypothetical protein B7733_16990 [Myxococcales bacterium FL481]